MGTITLPFLNYCVTFGELLRLFPRDPFDFDPKNRSYNT